MLNPTEFTSFQDTFTLISKLADREIFLLTDTNLEKLYFEEIFKHFEYLALAPGEEYKTMFSVENILEYMLRKNLSKKCLLIAIGGGLVTDVAGLVASLYKRGIDVAFFPTSLLCMVDASLGGKNGVNSQYFKNQFGTFKQPIQVNYDLNFLASLPHDQVVNGIAEMLKHGLIYSHEYFYKVADYFSSETLLEDIGELSALIKESHYIKYNFVKNDVYDNGKRRILNFGHTLGHTIEMHLKCSHGLAVLWGMQYALDISLKLEILSKETYNSISLILNKFNSLKDKQLPWQVIYNSIINDKKVQADTLSFILLEDIGKPCIKEILFSDLKEILSND